MAEGRKQKRKQILKFRSNKVLMVSCVVVAWSADCLRSYKVEMITSCLCSLTSLQRKAKDAVLDYHAPKGHSYGCAAGHGWARWGYCARLMGVRGGRTGRRVNWEKWQAGWENCWLWQPPENGSCQRWLPQVWYVVVSSALQAALTL